MKAIMLCPSICEKHFKQNFHAFKCYGKKTVIPQITLKISMSYKRKDKIIAVFR